MIIEPFSLIWWFEMYEQANEEEKKCLRRFHYYDEKGNTKETNNAMYRGLYLRELMRWIKNRIIDKYEPINMK